ncbi:MAG: hypothetical protein JNL61_08450 [Rhizobiaceae bacterium]|nr:hypothetical protein [Rhizobiaceae bacterium]
MTVAPLDQAELATLSLLADTLIPPAPGARSATEAGVTGPLLSQAIGYAPDLPDRLRQVIAPAAGRPAAEALAELKRTSPAAYDSFCETIAAIYFMSNEVRASVGFPGREAAPARVDVIDLEALLMPVLEAGFGPRPTEGGGSQP